MGLVVQNPTSTLKVVEKVTEVIPVCFPVEKGGVSNNFL